MAVLLAACDDAPSTPDGACPIYEPNGMEAAASRSGQGRALEAAWHDLGLIPSISVATGVVIVGSDVLVATDDGLWRRPLEGAGGWVRSGLEGHEVRALEKAPGREDLLFAGIAIPDTAASPSPGGPDDAVPSFYRSEDGGTTWVGHAEGLFDEERGLYEPVEYIVPRPGADGEVLYAGLGASTVARSTDGGTSWTIVKGQLGGFGYACQIHIPADDPGSLIQGCEAPLDIAWIRAHDISNLQQTDLGEGCLIADHDEISNRRPNVITSFPEVPGRVFAGLEGGLIEIREDGWDWIWRNEGEDTREPYTYVKFVWVNPDDPQHMVFGGGDGTVAGRGGLYETFDGGAEAMPLEGPAGVDFEDWGVYTGTPTNEGRDFVLVHLSDAGARVLKRTHSE